MLYDLSWLGGICGRRSVAGPPPDRELGGDHRRGPGFVSDLFGFVSDLLDLFGPREKPYFGAVALEMFFFTNLGPFEMPKYS